MTAPAVATNGALGGPGTANRSQVEGLLVAGYGTPSMAAALGLTRRTVRGHVAAIRRRWADEERAELDGKRAEVLRHLRRLAFALEVQGDLAAAARTWGHVGKLLGLGSGIVVAVDARTQAVPPDPATVRALLAPEAQARLAARLDEMDGGGESD